MKKIKTLLKSIIVAFSIYSKIPVPGFEWKSDDMKYHLAFFPFVGVVLGMIQYLWMYFSVFMCINSVVAAMISMFLIVLITGGLHIDGFMDTMDALHSYQDREKKLEILKDPHIGAFSVISLLAYSLLYIAGVLEMHELNGDACFLIFAMFFGVSRCISGIMVLMINPAKDSGMLRDERDMADKKTVKFILLFELLILLAGMVAISPLITVIIVFVQILVLLYTIHMMKKEFGGITGDLAGFYVTVSECACVVTLGIISIVGIYL